MSRLLALLLCSAAVLLASCKPAAEDSTAALESAADAATTAAAAPAATSTAPPMPSYAEAHLDDYASVALSADLSALDDQQKRMLTLLIEAANVMNTIFWKQTWGDQAALMERANNDAERRFIAINYGPWDRLNNDAPFIDGVGPKPLGARFYPENMSKQAFAKAELADKTSLYTLLRRDDAGALVTVPYHQAYRTELEHAAGLLRRAAELAHNESFAKYLLLRADALLSDEFRQSDLAWMDMQGNPIGLIIGPIETYEDLLFGYKASYEAYVLLKDQAWSEKLARFVKYLPELQRGLPVDAKYKTETPGSDADLNAYFALYYAGAANSGAKTIAVNLPNDEQVQLEKGTRRLQLENAMKAKFEKIMLPIGEVLIVEEQQDNISFDAFFQNTMFHEVAHGLGIKNTITGKGTVRKALKDQASSFEEGKADVLGLYMITKLAEKGELDKSELMDNYVTFLVSMIRSVRFGASDAHAIANMVRFNFFKNAGAFVRDEESARYRVDFDKMTQAINDLSAKLLTVQGDGDYAEAKRMSETLGVIGPTLAADLERLGAVGIPVDIVFEQGADVLGLEPAKP